MRLIRFLLSFLPWSFPWASALGRKSEWVTPEPKDAAKWEAPEPDAFDEVIWSALVFSALIDSAGVAITYVDHKGDETTRTVCPVTFLLTRDGSPAFGAWCILRRDYRTFMFRRVVSCEASPFRHGADLNLSAYGWAAHVERYGRRELGNRGPRW